MTKHFIAIAPVGREFTFKRASMIATPDASTETICKELNDTQYGLKTGECWHIYDNDFYYDPMITKCIKRNGRKIKVYRYTGEI